MLPALSAIHASHGARIGISTEDGFATPDDQVVQDHAADYAENHQHIKAANPANGLAADVGGERSIDVNLAEQEFIGNAGMALSAGLGQIRLGDRGSGIAGGKNIVHTVATGAVGDDLGSTLGSEAVIARKVSGGAISFDAESARDARLRGSARR